MYTERKRYLTMQVVGNPVSASGQVWSEFSRVSCNFVTFRMARGFNKVSIHIQRIEIHENQA